MKIQPTPNQIECWIKRYFKDFKISKHGEEIRINNPFTLDIGYHLWINVEKACIHDFRPQAGKKSSGSFLWFVKNYRKFSFREAVHEVMGSSINYINDIKSEKQIENTNVILPNEYKTLNETVESKAICYYLKSRCITEDQIQSYRIGYNGYDCIFPYIEDGEIVYWQSRSILNKKFNFPSDSDKSKFVYGIDNVEPGEPIIITESIFNSLMFDRAVSIGGSSLDIKQLQKLLDFGVDSIILALDNDRAGWAGIAKCADFRSQCKFYYSLMDIKDPEVDDWNRLAVKYGILACQQSLVKNIQTLDDKAAITLRLKSQL